MTAITATTEPMTAARRAEITAALAAIPAPPWHWIGDTVSGPHLVTAHSGWRSVMGFRRLGTTGAQPEFPTGPRGLTVLTPACDLIVPRGSHDTKMFRGIDHPVARFIENSGAYVAELLADNERLRDELAKARADAGGAL